MTLEKYRAYLAAPLFNDMERAFNLAIADALSAYVDVFLPQRDGQLLKELVAAGVPISAARAIVFQGDLRAIENSQMLIAILDGRTVDEGVAFELGYARALGKHCIGLKSDDRVMLPTGDNPMIVAGCHQICTALAELVAAVRSYSTNSSQQHLLLHGSLDDLLNCRLGRRRRGTECSGSPD